jgi:nucleotide-binding universal stress UspA family protein
MAYKDLLVYLDDSKGCGKRVDAAVRMAKQHDAHLTGVYPIVEIPLLHYVRRHIPRDVQASMDAEANALADAALKSFREAAERSGVAYETRTDHGTDTQKRRCGCGAPRTDANSWVRNLTASQARDAILHWRLSA